VTEKPIPFQLKKFADYGASHPAVARLSLQAFDLLNASPMDEATKDQVRQHLFRASDEMVKAQRKKDAFLEKCQRVADDMKAGRGIVVRGQALELREPEDMSDDFQLFLIHLTIALRMVLKAAGLILIGKTAGWPTIKKTIEECFPEGHPLRELLKQHETWTDVLFAARGEIEHDPFLFTGFKVEPSSAGVLQVADPKMPDGSSAVDAVRRYYDDGLVFAEELVVRAIESTYPPAFVLQEIPPEQRDATKPIRFKVAIRPGVLPAGG
jgi:hypothetical protein